MADLVQQDSKHRVAFDLALRIAHDEGVAVKRDATNWLKLYESALTVVNGGSAEQAIKTLPKKGV
ncbi:MAG: hypothetical protein QOI88_3371 [Gammaproteobacteria bacterium]|jgi:hypothetical protein|nr:hypothetical protein [Gammaproteobacteria bacterium]